MQLVPAELTDELAGRGIARIAEANVPRTSNRQSWRSRIWRGMYTNDSERLSRGGCKPWWSQNFLVHGQMSTRQLSLSPICWVLVAGRHSWSSASNLPREVCTVQRLRCIPISLQCSTRFKFRRECSRQLQRLKLDSRCLRELTLHIPCLCRGCQCYARNRRYSARRDACLDWLRLAWSGMQDHASWELSTWTRQIKNGHVLLPVVFGGSPKHLSSEVMLHPLNQNGELSHT